MCLYLLARTSLPAGALLIITPFSGFRYGQPLLPAPVFTGSWRSYEQTEKNKALFHLCVQLQMRRPADRIRTGLL